MNKIGKTCFNIIAAIGAMIFGFLAWYSWRFTHRMYTDNEDIVVMADSIWRHLLTLLLLLALMALFSWVAQWISERTMHYIAIGICICVTAFLFLFIQGAHAFAVVDQQHINGTAVELAKGNFIEMGPGEYFSIVPYQLGLVKLFALIYQVSGNQLPDTLRYVQAVCVGLSIYAGFLIVRRLWHQVRIELLYLVCMLLFFPLHLYSIFLYGETLGVCGTLCGIWCFLNMNESDTPDRRREVLWGLLTIGAVSIAYIARSALVVVWIAMMFLQIFIFIRKKRVLPLMLTMGILLGMMGGQKLLIHSIEQESGLSLKQGMPIVLNLAMGLQGDVEEGDKPGAYNGYNWNTFRDFQLDQKTSAEQARIDISERLDYWCNHPEKMVMFFKTKLLNQWNEPGYGSFSMTRFMEEPENWISQMYYGPANEILYGILNQFQAVLYLMMFLFFIVLLVKSNREETEYLMGLIAIGGVIFSALYEAKSRYVYPFAVVCILYMVAATSLSHDWIKTHIKKIIGKQRCVKNGTVKK